MDARKVAPEWLDFLPVNSAEAIRSRRDLRIIHRFMGTRRWLTRQLENLPQKARCSIAELGAGDGLLLRELKNRMEDLRVCGYDRIGPPTDWPTDWDWRTGDLLELDHFAEHTLIALLVLHHFQNDTLLALGKRIDASAIRYLVVVEPARHPASIKLLRAGWLLGFCKTTLHDGDVSIRAGFCDEELPALLGLDPTKWQWHCETTFSGAYRMLARKIQTAGM